MRIAGLSPLTGVAAVLSTHTNAPRAFETLETAARSTTLHVGLAGVSHHTSAVPVLATNALSIPGGAYG